MTDIITTLQMLRALESMCDTIENEKEYLSELDGAIGDGDHGVNMAKCFREVKKKLAANPAEDVGALFKDVGMVVLNSVGGAMGALYGTFFLKLSQESAAKNDVNLSDLVAMFQTGEQGVLDIGVEQIRLGRLGGCPILELLDEQQPGHGVEFLRRRAHRGAERAGQCVDRHQFEDDMAKDALPATFDSAVGHR